MNKKILLSSLVILAALVSYNLSYAAGSDSTANKAVKKDCIEKNVKPDFKKMPPPPECMGPPPFDAKFQKGHPGMHPYFHPSKEEMAAKKAEIDKRLQITDEQKKELEKNKEIDRAKIKPIMEKMEQKKKELHDVYKDDSLSQNKKDKKAEKIRKEIGKLKIQADNQRKENMKHFESVLTEEQKVEFEKIKQEQKVEMEKKKAEFEQKRKEYMEAHPEFQNKKGIGFKPPIHTMPVPDVKK